MGTGPLRPFVAGNVHEGPSISVGVIFCLIGMFVDQQYGKAEDATSFYTSVFRNASVDHILRYGKDEKPNKEGTIKHAGVVLEGTSFAFMDSARAHNFTFNEAISSMVSCNDQQK